MHDLTNDEARARRDRRRLAWLLAAVAIGFYVGFILLAMYRAN